MQEFVLSCCSTADLSAERLEARDVSYICFHYELDGEQLPDDLGKTVPFEVFYQIRCDFGCWCMVCAGIADRNDQEHHSQRG